MTPTQINTLVQQFKEAKFTPKKMTNVNFKEIRSALDEQKLRSLSEIINDLNSQRIGGNSSRLPLKKFKDKKILKRNSRNKSHRTRNNRKTRKNIQKINTTNRNKLCRSWKKKRRLQVNNQPNENI